MGGVLLISFIALILAFILSIFTAIELSRGKGQMANLGYLILFIMTHLVLLSITAGCAVVLDDVLK